MSTQNIQLRRLLTGGLPLERVGPQLRHAARRALRSGDEERMLQVAVTAVGELMRRGDLLRVAVQADHTVDNQGGPFCLVRGTQRLVDLAPLGSRVALGAEPGRSQVAPPANEPGDADPRPTRPVQSLRDFTGVVGALEDASDLRIGDPQSGEKAVILESILKLLGKFVPQFRFFILVDDLVVQLDEASGVFQADAKEMDSGWLPLRAAGHSVWIPSPRELPAHIRRQDGRIWNAAEDPEPFGFQATVAVPLWSPHPTGESSAAPEEAGLLFLVARQEWGREALLGLADRLSRFVTRRWQYQQDVNQRIHTDGLTGLFNRKYFDAQFPLELERARRAGRPLTLVIADLDHFTDINTRFGHQGGDLALQMVARRLQEELRKIDHICRIGGEEFALILPETTQEAGQEVIGRLLDAPFHETMVKDGETIDMVVTISYGAITFPVGGGDPFELHRKADSMLYLSKDLGRNQCHFWSNEGEHVQLLPTAETA